MIKRQSKLNLHRETVLRLNGEVAPQDLFRVRGGDVSTDNRAACTTHLSGEPN